MGFEITYPTINGNYTSWAEVDFSVAGFDIADIKSIEWGSSVEVADVYGAGPMKLGTTRGQDKPDVLKVEMYIAAVNLMESSLAAQSDDGASSSQPQTQAMVQWAASDGTYPQVKFYGIRLVKIGQSSKIGTDAEYRPLEFNVTRVTRIGPDGSEFGLLNS